MILTDIIFYISIVAASAGIAGVVIFEIAMYRYKIISHRRLVSFKESMRTPEEFKICIQRMREECVEDIEFENI